MNTILGGLIPVQFKTVGKGRKRVDELTRGQGSMRHKSIAQPLVSLSTRQLVN